MNTQKLQDDIRNTIQTATGNKSGELTAADIQKVQDAVDKKLEAAAEQAAR
jgi:hypothetical protein